MPNTRILIHQGSAGFRGNVPDIEIVARETLLLTNRLVEIMSLHTGQPFDVIKHDTERDKYMSADEAKKLAADVEAQAKPSVDAIKAAVGPCKDHPALSKLAGKIPGL